VDRPPFFSARYAATLRSCSMGKNAHKLHRKFCTINMPAHKCAYTWSRFLNIKPYCPRFIDFVSRFLFYTLIPKKIDPYDILVHSKARQNFIFFFWKIALKKTVSVKTCLGKNFYFIFRLCDIHSKVRQNFIFVWKSL
jgi:hypothetical protein